MSIKVNFTLVQGIVFNDLQRRDFYVRLNALCLDRTTGRRVITRSCQPDTGAVTQVKYRLHRTLAERSFADNQGAAMILQGTGQNFRGRCGTAIYQNNHGGILQPLARVRCIFQLGIGAAVGVYDESLVQKTIGYRDGGLKHTAGIVAQVQHNTLQRTAKVAFHVLNLFLQFCSTLPGEMGDLKITVVAVHRSAEDTDNTYIIAHQRML